MVLTTRIFIANERLSEWRHEHLLGKKSTLVRFADLGFKVLDEATVEVSAYVMSQLPSFDRTAVFHNVLSSIAKDDALLRSIQAGVDSLLQSAYAVDFFLKVPAFVLCYWLSSTLLNALGLANIQADGSPARVDYRQAIIIVLSQPHGSSPEKLEEIAGGVILPKEVDINRIRRYSPRCFFELKGSSIK